MRLLGFVMIIAVLLAFSFPQPADAGTDYWVVEHTIYLDGEWLGRWQDDGEDNRPDMPDDWWRTSYAGYTYYYETHWDPDLNEDILCLAAIIYSDSWVDSDGNSGSMFWNINFNCDH